MGFKPSKEEQKWAKKQEIDLKKILREYTASKKSQEGGEPVTEPNCPADNSELERIEIDATGIFIHKCQVCGGLWINRASAEKLFHSVEKSNKLTRYLAKVFNIHI